MRLSVSLVALGSLQVAGVLALAAPGNAERAIILEDRSQFIPKNRFVPLPGRVIGVLVRNPHEVLALQGRDSVNDQYWFSTQGSSYLAVFVRDATNPRFERLEAPLGDTGEKRVFENLSLATRDTLGSFGIRADLALVEVEVNGGHGSPVADSFVATTIRRVDGTDAFRANLSEAASKVADLYRNWLSSERSRIEAALEQAAVKALGTRPATGPREQMDVVFVTWLPKERCCRFSFQTTITNGDYQYEGNIRIELTPSADAQSPSKQGKSRSMSLRYGQQFGVELGRAYDVRSDGTVQPSVVLPIEAFQRELKPRGLLEIVPSRSPPNRKR